MGRGAGQTASRAAVSCRSSARRGSPLVRDRTVSRAALAGRNGMSTGVWFHVTPTENAERLRTEGILKTERVQNPNAASWLDPDAVYVWPTEDAARDWVEFRRDGGYGGRFDSSYDIVAVNARPDEVAVCPDNEDFGEFLGAWAAVRYSGDRWPGPDDSDSADFYQSLRHVTADGLTLEQWLDREGDGIFWGEDDDDALDGDDLDERVIAQDMVRMMPASLRRAVCEHYAAHGRALMLLSNVPPSRVVTIVP